MFQVNLQRSKLATNELLIEAKKQRAAVALVQEPYTGNTGVMKSQRGVRVFQNSVNEGEVVKAAIAVFDCELDVIQYPELTTNNIVVVRVQTKAWQITLVSYYLERDRPLDPYLDLIRKIERKTGPQRTIIGGDANAKSAWWGSGTEDQRGKQISGFLNELGLQILNTGDTPTFDTVRGGKRYSSRVDVTACSLDMLGLIDAWRVDVDLTCSDHNGITFNINLEKSTGMYIQRTTRLFNTKKANWSQFHEKLTQIMQDNSLTVQNLQQTQNIEQIDNIVELYQKSITDTCKQTIPVKKKKEVLTIPWWSDELAEMKAEVATRRRRIRNAALVRRAMVVKLYLEHKDIYELAVKKAQTESWMEFCRKQDREGVWEGIYRVIGRTAVREEDTPLQLNGVALDAKSSAELLAQTFYPEDRREDDDMNHAQTREQAEKVNLLGHNDNYDPPFTQTELSVAIKSFNPKKAPGADGFTADICAGAVRSDPVFFLALLNKCLEFHYFPHIWKEAIIVILRKPGKDSYTVPKSYRPIGLLPVLGKVYEKMLMARIKFYILPRISTRQYGFMPQKSTEDSLFNLMRHIRAKLDEKRIVTLVSLDIEGAFDSAWWPAIKTRLAEEKCPINLRRVVDSYLSERAVRLRYCGEECRRETSKGCVQGSIGGPILWNLLLDSLLKQLDGLGVYHQAFADDVVLVFDGDSALAIARFANTALDHVRTWGIRNRLKFAPHKTCAMVVTRRLKYDAPRLSMGGVNIEMSNELKLLGLNIDCKLTFEKHVATVCKKAINIYKQLARAARVNWGLHPEVVRMIYTAAVEPIILYAASAWSPSASKLGIRKRLNAVQRGFAQKICKAYRTVSLNSALVLAGLLPLDLRIMEAASLYEAKRGFPCPELGDREVERMAPVMELPHPSIQETILFGRLSNREEYIASNHRIKLFTDGSKIEGKVGAAFSLWEDETETGTKKLSLPSYCSVYQAELLALHRAVEATLKHKGKDFGIYSDSMSALQTVSDLGSTHPLAVDIRNTLSKSKIQNKSVSLYWIKAHAGLEGNERADELAKEAALRSKKRPDYDRCPTSFVKRRIRMGTISLWETRYKLGETAAITKMFFPTVEAAFKVIKKVDITNVITQLMTGHGGFSSYLNRFKCKEDPSCACEQGVDETVPHLIFSCPIFLNRRFNLEQKINVTLVQENLADIIYSKNRDEFLDYCTEIVKIVILRNKTQ